MGRQPKISDLTIKWEPTQAMVTAYSRALIGFVSAVENVPDEQKGELHELLWSTVMQGFDRARLTEQLAARFGLSLRDAAEMSRYQCALAKVVMENARRLDMGITEAVWLHAGVPCDDAPHHERLNKRRYKIAEGVVVNGKQIWPGTAPGCKCCSKSVVEDFD